MKTKRVIHEWFMARIRDNTLIPLRGCTRKVVVLGEEIEETATKEPHRSLTANIGDDLMLFGASLEQIQIVTVTAIRADGWKTELVVSRGVGAVNDGEVHVHKMRRVA